MESLRQLFAIEPTANRLRARLAAHHRAGDQSRILAGYGWAWASKKNPEALDGGPETSVEAGTGPPIPDLSFRWATGGADGQRDFNLGTGSLSDPRLLFGFGVNEPATVGYALTVRGWEFEHVGILWSGDLVWRENAWRAVPELVHGSDFPSWKKATREELAAGGPGPAHAELVRRLAGAYRILFTRGLSTVRVWFADAETGAHMRQEWESWLDA